MTEKLEKAIEVLKQLYAIRTRQCGFYKTSEEAKSLQTLLDLAQTTLALSKAGIPQKISIENLKSKPCPYSKEIQCCTMQDFVRNQTIDEMLAWFLERLDKEKMVDILFDKFKLGSGRSNEIAQSLIDCLTGKES